jgi:hypothetical protein
MVNTTQVGLPQNRKSVLALGVCTRNLWAAFVAARAYGART